MHIFSEPRRTPHPAWTWALGALLSICLAACSGKKSASGGNEFLRLMNVGKSLYEQGQATNAVDSFQKAVALMPTDLDARLNLANAHLLAAQSDLAINQAREVLQLEPNSAAAHYIEGCAHLRLGKFEDAIKALQIAKDLDRTINAASFQLGRAFQGAGQFEEALLQFQEVVQFETNQTSALLLAVHYNLSQVLVRMGKTDEAQQEAQAHQQILAARGNVPNDPAFFERCVYTQARVPFVLEQPDPAGGKIQFTDATQKFFGGSAGNFRAPFGILDINHRGQNDLFLREGEAAFRLLMNSNGSFAPKGEPLPATNGANFSRVLVGDLNNDRHEDVIVVGDRGVQAFRFATNGAVVDATRFANLTNAPGTDGALVDLDFTGKLDLLLFPPGASSVRLLRNLGNMYFKDVTATSNIPALVARPINLVVEDWNNDDISDLLVTREGQPPLLLIKQRGGSLIASNAPPEWPAASAAATGDLNNDLRADLVLAAADRLECFFNGLTNSTRLPLGNSRVDHLALVDYDNDGWLDVIAAGDGLRAWRNLGQAGFREVTADLGFDKLVKGRVDGLAAADFDNDCATDFLLSLAGQGVQLLRSEGTGANKLVKLQLMGNRSNASGLGVRVELVGGHWRTIRTVQRLPVEVGVGPRVQLDSINVRWFDLALSQAEVDVKSCAPLAMTELVLPTGSCPYLYAWDGRRFRFVTDLLGASPVGLPVAEGVYISADPDEYVWIGSESAFQPRDGNYILQITEELREVLYLDEAKLVVVDHPPDVEIYPTDKLLPRPPFPKSDLVPLHRPRPLLRATRHDGLDVTEALQGVDGRVASPAALRVPQLRGQAEPHSVTLDFGPLDVARPWALGLTGWLRFGGGMANIAASHDPNLPFPFPVLEAETAEGEWQKIDVAVGAPAGKTKRLFVDLAGKLPAGTRRLRLGAAFEIHWDQAVLFEKPDAGNIRQTVLTSDESNLHWRGFSEFADLPWTQPLTPDYERVRARANWRITPSGWCTRYGPVDELIAQADDAHAILNGGDELTLRFAAGKLPPKPAGWVRDFFVYTVGWDKDSDFHVKRGTTVEPMPYRGMNDQLYGGEPRPERLRAADELMSKFNTRWVGPMTLSRAGLK